MTAELEPGLPACSVVIPTYNRPSALSRCLHALSQSDYPRELIEVIVVDDGGSTDISTVAGSFDDRLNLTIIRQANAGPAQARNRGVSAAKCDAIAFIDDDCSSRPDWLATLMRTLQRNPGALVGGAARNALHDNLYAAASQMILDVVDRHFNRDRHDATFFPSENMAVSRRRFMEIGGFDPNFRWSEDRDLCDRWSARGWPLVIAPDAIVDHSHEMDFAGFCRQHFGYGRGACRFHRARRQRGTGQLEVEGSFYYECLREPFRTARFPRSIFIGALMGVWQFVNTAGFFYEMSRLRRESAKTAATVR